MFHKDDIEVLPSEMCVTVGGLYFEDALLHLKDGDIEGTAAKIVDGDDAGVVAIETVGKGSGCGFVDDTEDFEASNFTGIFGSL
jgi:hypothetical protein